MTRSAAAQRTCSMFLRFIWCVTLWKLLVLVGDQDGMSKFFKLWETGLEPPEPWQVGGVEVFGIHG